MNANRASRLILPNFAGERLPFAVACTGRKGFCRNATLVDAEDLANIGRAHRAFTERGWLLAAGTARMADGTVRNCANPICHACAADIRKEAGVIAEPAQHTIKE